MSLRDQISSGFGRLTTAILALKTQKQDVSSVVYTGSTAPDIAVTRIWIKPDGTQWVWDGTVWFQVPGTPGATGATGPAGTNGTNGTNGIDGGSALPNVVTINVPLVAHSGYAEVVLVDASVTALSIIKASFVGEKDAENDVEELKDSDLDIAGVPEAGQIRFVLTANSPFVGNFKIIYEVFNP
jgi:hypothetical protein